MITGFTGDNRRRPPHKPQPPPVPFVRDRCGAIDPPGQFVLYKDRRSSEKLSDQCNERRFEDSQ